MEYMPLVFVQERNSTIVTWRYDRCSSQFELALATIETDMYAISTNNDYCYT